ncbi:fibrosin-like 1 isoform X2 [Brachyhypopomus gauderio]|uniref:fibrosin-like 1 isoform X2 n=1 Tax=Brachyhypopomus gauderio TaxID=698409 RepID=UPI0040434031
MEGKVKQTRRSRSQRERVRRREAGAGDARDHSPSSASEPERSPGKDRASHHGPKAPHSSSSCRASRPPRRKRRESGSQEEDVIDGFAIASFASLDRLENGSLKLTGRKDRWEATPVQCQVEVQVQAEVRAEVRAEVEERVHLEREANSFRELPVSLDHTQEHVKERLLKKTYSKKNKRFKSVLGLTGKPVAEQNVPDLNSTAQRGNSKDRLSESSTHSLSGRGYSASDVGSEKLFSPPGSKGVTSNESLESKTCSAAKVSGLQRSQEQSHSISFAPPIPSPTPASAPTGSPAPAATAAPPPRPRPNSPPLLSVKKEAVPPNPTPPLIRNPSHQEHRVPPPSHHSRPIISHHLPLPYNLHDISNSPASLPPKHRLPPSPHHLSGLPSPGPPLPPLRGGAVLATLLSPPPLPSLPPPRPCLPLLLRCPLLLPYPPTAWWCLDTQRLRPTQFDKYTPKLDNPFLRQSSFFSSYPAAMPAMPPLLPHPGPFSSLQGAFQPKASNPIDVAARPGAVPHTLLQKDPRVADAFRTPVRKPGKWCAVHVQIAWQIYHHQQKMKQMQMDPHKLDMNGKLDLFSRPPAPGVFPGFPYPHDLARPLFSSTGSGHPAASPYGPAPHHSGFLPPPHLADAFSRSSSFGGLSNLSASAFGGLGNPALGASTVFGPKEGPALPGFGSPHHDTWNRLHRTPPSFPTPPQWPKTTESERSSSANSHDRDKRDKEDKDRDRDRDRWLCDSGLFSSLSAPDELTDSLDRNRHSNRSSPGSAPVSYQISSLIRSSSQNSADLGRSHGGGDRSRAESDKDLLERQREVALMADVKVKESRSPGKESSERATSSVDSCKPGRRSPSPYTKGLLAETGIKMGALLPLQPVKDAERDRKRDRDTPSGETVHKVKNDMKIKEERKEEQEVMVVSSEPAPHPQVPPLPHQAPPTAHQHVPVTQQPPPPSPRGSELSTGPPLHAVPMPHSLPFPMGAVHQMSGLNMLDRARMAPFMGVGPLAAGRDRLPHPAFSWDPLREAYRNLDLQRRMDFQLRSEQGHRFPGLYDPERVYREREPHEYSHQEHLMEVRREQERLRQQAEERERLHLREELDRARLHQLHQSPMEGHLPHMPPFMSHLGGMPYPRLSPSAGQGGLLNRTPPTAALSAPPPLVPAGPPRVASPRRTTPITTQDPREYSPSRNPKEVEAR